METLVTQLDDGTFVKHYRCDVVIVGSGASGLNCAERLFDVGITDLAIVTTQLLGGTSYCSGSDKQTYYKMSVFGDTLDSPLEMAHSLFDGGCMDGKLAYIESLFSLPAFYHLVENDVPFPYNEYGAFVGYKTDHDPRQRATSAGPRTSRYMVEASLRNVRARNIPIFDRHTVVRIVTTDKFPVTVCGLIALDETRLDEKSLGITIFQTHNVILATGGPGELYAESVYPPGQVSLHGVALEACASAVNLGECQFGITSTDFRWNLSGTYQQVIPSYFSDRGGSRHNFLSNYYPTLADEASNIFLKGYQWPFSARYATGFGSSLIDIAVEIQRKAGYLTFLDFSNNPSRECEEFNIDKLFPEVREYLTRSGALQKTPYERLAFMNPESIEIYSEQGIDLKSPLRIAVSFQHNNGGLKVDDVYQTNIQGLFAIGEIAGAHGVVRPGGAALNSGQVAGIRVAQYLRSRGCSVLENSPELTRAANCVLGESRYMLSCRDVEHSIIRNALQRRMSDSAGFIRVPTIVRKALSEARAIDHRKLRARNSIDLPRAWETRNLLLTSQAFLTTIEAYISSGGGSRGSYLIIHEGNPGDENVEIISSVSGPIFTCRTERLEHRMSRIVVSDFPSLSISWEEVSPLPQDDSWFETVWSIWRESIPGRTRKPCLE